MTDKGKIVLLGCFCAAPQQGGNEYMSAFARLTGHNVIADQGESFLGWKTFMDHPIGYLPKPPKMLPSYWPMTVENAKKWSEATPLGQINTTIGNIRFDEYGNPYTDPKPTSLTPGQLPSWQSYFQHSPGSILMNDDVGKNSSTISTSGTSSN